MTVKDFGITKDGIATKLYTLKNTNLEISVTDFGSTLVSIVVPDRNNKPTDIVLGYDDVSGYETDDGYYFGCNVTLSFLCYKCMQFTLSPVDRMIQDWYKIIQFCYSGIFISLLQIPIIQLILLRCQDAVSPHSFSPKDRTINRRAEAVGRCQVPFSSRTQWREHRWARYISTALLQWQAYY